MIRRTSRSAACVAAVAAVTFAGARLTPVNATTIGFAYLLLVLVVASTWGFVEAIVTSLAATVAFNYFSLPPVGTLTIADPQNWIALFSFLTTSLIASRLSTKARRRAADALERQQDLERLYTFSRAILLIGGGEPVARELIRKLTDTFVLDAAVLFDRRSGEFHRAGPGDSEGVEGQLRDASLSGTTFTDSVRRRTITAVRLGSEPIASLALVGSAMPDSVLQGIANLVAIGLERAEAQELSHRFEVARQSEQLRTTLIDAMAHEFKTPLTLIKGATTAVLGGGDGLAASVREQLTIADEECDHLRELIDNAIEMARLDTAHIDVTLEPVCIEELAREVVASMQSRIDERPVSVSAAGASPCVPLDRRLARLALKQLFDNALKYSPPGLPVDVRVGEDDGHAFLDVTDHGAGIPPRDQGHVFERFYRGEAARGQIPGSGLGLTIADSILRAHHGALTVTSRPGETTFRMALPMDSKGGTRP
jgi:two-component system, OmpR family, sensor histidine kinase KdpD